MSGRNPTASARQPQVKPENRNGGGTLANDDKPDVERNSTEKQPVVRRITFHYRFRVKGLTTTKTDPSQQVRVWMPCPSNSPYQKIKRLDATAPVAISESMETEYNNRILYFQTPVPESGEFTVDIPYEIARKEVLRGDPVREDRPVEKLDAGRRTRFLAADRMVPTTGKPLKLLDSITIRKDKLGLARQLYDLVDGHVTYKKEGTGWGRGDTNWVCDSGYGNCTDFHSLFISLARSQGIPARFEIGFSIPTDKTEGPVTGYHCWAWFYIDGRGWIPVDISEADKLPKMKEYYFGNLTADRVAFSEGRDLKLVPESSNQPLNFLIHPYIEVGGKTLPSENVELQHTFAALPD